MTETSPRPLCTGPRDMALLAFVRAPEGPRLGAEPVAYVLVVLRSEGRVLMTYQRRRECWELPGGGIEPGETPRAAAVRELREETGQRAGEEALRFAGYARTALGPDRPVLLGAVYTAELPGPPRPFVPNDEVSRVCWRTGEEPLPGGRVQTVDEYLVRRCAEG